MAVLVGDDAVVEVGVTVHDGAAGVLHSAVDAVGELGLDGVAVALADHHGLDGNTATVGAGAHGDDAVALVVDDDRGNGAGVLGVQGLDAELTVAAIDDRDAARGETGKGGATVGRGRVLEGAAHARGGEGRAEVGGGGGVVTGDAGRRGHGHQSGGGRGPLEHLHARVGAVRRGGEVGVVGAGAVLGVGIHRVTAGAAAAVVVLLEVTGGLIEAVLVKEIVDDVVPVEEIDDRRVLVVDRALGEVEGRQEVEGGATVGTEAAGVVAVTVFLGGHVVTAGIGKLRTRHTVGVVPAEGRRSGVGRVGLDGARTVVRALFRNSKRLVGLPAHPVALVQHGTVGGVDPHVVPVTLIGGLDLQVPSETQAAVFEGVVNELGRNGLAGHAGRGEETGFLDAGGLAQALDLTLGGQAEMVGGGEDGVGGAQGRGHDRGLGGGATDQTVTHVDDLAVGSDVDVGQRVDDLETVDLLHEIEVMGTVVLGDRLTVDDDLTEGGGTTDALHMGAIDVLHGDVEGRGVGFGFVGKTHRVVVLRQRRGADTREDH